MLTLILVIALLAHPLITYSESDNLLRTVWHSPTYSSSSDKIVLAVTAAPLAYIASFIGGSRVAVHSLIPAGVDPHHFEPSTMHLINSLSNVSIVLMTGPSHLVVESRIHELAQEGIVKAHIVDYRDYIRHGLTLLVNPKTGRENPHGYLFTYSGLLAAASALAEALTNIDPTHKDYYFSRLQELRSMLAKDNQSVRELLSGNFKVALFTPILQYVVKELGLECSEIVLQEPEAELKENALKELIDLYKEKVFDVLLITDIMAAKNPKVLNMLRSSRIPYIVVPISTLSNVPYLIPAVVAGSLSNLKNSAPSAIHGPANAGVCVINISEIPTTLAISEAILIVILAVIVVLQRKFIESKVISGE